MCNFEVNCATLQIYLFQFFVLEKLPQIYCNLSLVIKEQPTSTVSPSRIFHNFLFLLFFVVPLFRANRSTWILKSIGQPPSTLDCRHGRSHRRVSASSTLACTCQRFPHLPRNLSAFCFHASLFHHFSIFIFKFKFKSVA